MTRSHVLLESGSLKRRWLGFQLCSLIVASAMTAAVVPVFIVSLRPLREQEQAPGDTRCGPLLVDWGYCGILEKAERGAAPNVRTCTCDAIVIRRRSDPDPR
jgi:hypothetical protein